MVIPIAYPDCHELTGKIRYRLGWRGKLVLQVEESFKMKNWDIWADAESKIYKHWRDATIQDVSKGEIV